MKKKSMEELIRRISDLPMLPSVLMELNKATRDMTFTVDEAGEIIIKDPALTSKILKLANSSYYGLSYKVNTLKRAITVLGFNTIRNLAVTVSVFEIFNKKTPALIDIKGLWRHSMACAVAGKALMKERANIVLQEKAFLACLLHDTGKVIMAQYMPEEMNKIIKSLIEDKTLNEIELEEELTGYNHADIGGSVAGKWHFPEELALAIKFHHNPEVYMNKKAEDKKEEELVRLILSVYAGNQIVKALGLGKSTDTMADNINEKVWDLLGIYEKNIEGILFDIKSSYENIIKNWEF